MSRPLRIQYPGAQYHVMGRHNKPRSVAIALARDLSGMGLQQIADHFKLGSYKTVSAHHRRLIKSFIRNKKLSKQYQDLKNVISK